jgi:hypothetical protein
MPLSSSQDDESAVDDEVGAGDVAGAIVGQQHDQVGHLFGTGEPSHYRAGGSLFGGISGFDAAGAGDRLGDIVLAEPQRVETGPGLTVLTQTPRGPTSLDSDLDKFSIVFSETLYSPGLL